jgi:prepilin-type N-terminal cleavage/methylation domain-containing protein
MKVSSTAISIKHPLTGGAGFTLMEVIVSLVLAGILASIAGMGIVAAISGYAVVRENVGLSQKIQLAATRIQRELLELTDIDDRDDTRPYIVYFSATGQRQAIAKVDDTIRLYVDPSALSDAYLENNGDILTDHVASFTLNYLQGASNWTGADIRELSTIDFSLNLFRTEVAGSSVTLTTRVHLRNNDNYGGSAAPLVIDPPTGDQYGCFISAAGSGSFDNSLPRIPRFIGWALVLIALLGVAGRLYKPADKYHPIWFIFWHFRGGGNAKRIEPFPDCRSYRQHGGSALIGIIVTILVFAGLGAAIVPMISSSQLHRTAAGRSDQAYYLAESGLRYAASQYLNATGETAQFTALDNLHGIVHRLQGNQGQFTVSVNPYYFLVDVDPANTTTLTTRIYGALAPLYTLPGGGGRLSIEDTIYTFNSASIAGQNITFNMSASLAIPADTPVYPIAEALVQTVKEGEDLSLSPGSGDMFPDRNGAFVLNGETYTYRENNRDTHTLVGIKRTDGASFADVDLIVAENIRLKKFVRVTSTGAVGSGDMMASREIVYHVQIPEEMESRRTVFEEAFDGLDKWNPSLLGAHEITELGGNNVLRVTGVTQSGADTPSASLIALNTDAVQFNPDRFDAQVKIGYLETSVPPINGYDPLPVPTYYSAGLCFRLTGDGNTYGLSFQRGNASASPVDNIENDLVPTAGIHAIVLWQATDNGSDQQWLAYKQIDDVLILEEDAESGDNGWTTVGDAGGNALWHIDSHPPGYAAASHAWYYGVNATRTYNTGNGNSGTLVSPSISLCDFDSARLRFSSWHETDPDPSTVNTTDYKYLDVSTDGGANWIEGIYQITTPETAMGLWQEIEIDLSAYTGQTIMIRFRFDTGDAQNNDWEGWYVDNIRVLGNFPVDRSTLLARFKTSASVTFNNGGPDAIEAGDRIIGDSSGASATVYGQPVLQNVNWAASTATGTLLLDEVNGVFQIGERLLVPGKSELATLTGFRAQDHFIKAFVGTETGCGTPNANPLDGEKRALPLDPAQLEWPPDEGASWTAEKDFYQLIQWDEINSAVATIDIVDAIDEPRTLIRSSEPALMNPGSTLGLHTFGNGSLNIYFDDFGYQSFVDQPVAISQPIQY